MRGKALFTEVDHDIEEDHPRLCGEKFSFGVVEDILDRITPAYAGKRLTRCTDDTEAKDHPRLCGEKGG